MTCWFSITGDYIAVSYVPGVTIIVVACNYHTFLFIVLSCVRITRILGDCGLWVSSELSKQTMSALHRILISTDQT